MKSIVTDETEYCIFCGNRGGETHHLLFGTYGRKFAEEHGLKVPICAACHTRSEYLCERIHDNTMAEKLSKMLGQAFYECDKRGQGMSQNDERSEFIREYGQSFI